MFTKKGRKNFSNSPRTTKKGIFYSLLTIVIGSLGTWLMTKNPAMGEFVNENTTVIVSGIIAVAGLILERFSRKEDK